MPKPSVWIDATNTLAGTKLWGMTIVERQIREFSLRGFKSFRVFVKKDDLCRLGEIRSDFTKIFSVRIDWIKVSETQDFWMAVGGANKPLILVAGDTIYDERVISFVLHEGPGVIISSADRSICYVTASDCETISISSVNNWKTLSLKIPFLIVIQPEDLDQYIPSLRLKMPAFIINLVEGESVRDVENHMFRRTFKGAIDVVARYGYYHLVRWLTRLLVGTSITPNTYTVFSILCVWGASPLLATGWTGTGLFVAWLGVILDSVDGKLARLRLHLSDTMGGFEHIAAAPGLALWFVAIGWYLNDGNLLSWSSETVIVHLLLLSFVLDKICSGLFKYFIGRELFDYERFDTLFHLFAARRNIALLIFSIGFICDYLALSFELFGMWMVVTFLVHFFRAGWIVFKKITL